MKNYMFLFLFSTMEYILTLLIIKSINIINYDYVTLKYSSFRFSAAKDSPTGLNMIIKIFLPPIYIVILSGILYNLGYNNLVKNIYLVQVIYYIIKWIVCIVILNRKILINWKNEFFSFVTSFLLSYLIYYSFIVKTTQIFISVEELRDGIWIGIITFFFSIIIKIIYNQTKLNLEKQKEKNRAYIRKSYNKFKKQYGHIIKTRDKALRNLTYSIMIYENYNRPAVVRIFEYAKFLITGYATLGVMQVWTWTFITNEESVIKGYKIIKDAYKLHEKLQLEDKLQKIIFLYNKDNKYVEEVMYIYCVLEEQ